MRAVKADFLVRGGTIYTLDPTRPRATAVAALGETIVAFDGDAEGLRGPGTRVLELGGRTAIPG